MNDSLYDELKQSGLKLKYIADKLGIDRTTLYRKLKGKSKLSKEELENIKVLLEKVK